MAKQKKVLTTLSCIFAVSTVLHHVRVVEDVLEDVLEKDTDEAEKERLDLINRIMDKSNYSSEKLQCPSGYTFSHNGYWTNWLPLVKYPAANGAQLCAQRCANYAGCIALDYMQTWQGFCYIYTNTGYVRPKNNIIACRRNPPTPTPTPAPTPPPFLDWRKITCPVLAMLFRNGDIQPNTTGFTSNDTVFRALTRVGVSAFQARSAVFGNFNFLNPLDPSINLFAMNTGPLGPGSQRPLDPSGSGFGAHEHFRSTGIRDDLISSARFDFTEMRCATPYTRGAGWKNRDIRCATDLWDHEVASGGGSAELGFTNDIFLPRPVVDGVECGPQDSGLAKCPSALHGSLNAMHQEFGTPTGIRSFVSKEDYRNMWMSAEYPPDFASRSPRSCVDETQDPASASGCNFCLAQTSTAAGVGYAPNQRYCRCMLQTDLTQSQLESIPQYGSLGCPTGENARQLRCFRFNPPSACTNVPRTDPLDDPTLLPSTQQSCEPYCPTNEAFRCSLYGKTFFTSSADCRACGGTLVFDVFA